MSPSILVRDCETQQFVKVFTESSELLIFLAYEERLGVDVKSKYLVYSFTVNDIFSTSEAIDAISASGYLCNKNKYETE
jgi:hypothetical protein